MKKQYGASRIESCPFCDKQAITKNSQGVPVCPKHRKNEIKNVKCACGEWLDMRQGKWGPFFTCINCGSLNFKKVLEFNPQVRQAEKKEVTVRSDEVDFI